jgi:hypothetical protein
MLVIAQSKRDHKNVIDQAPPFDGDAATWLARAGVLLRYRSTRRAPQITSPNPVVPRPEQIT